MKWLALLIWLMAGAALAQTSPGFQTGQTLGAAQLNGAFQAKSDWPWTGIPSRGPLQTTDLFAVQVPGALTLQSVPASVLASYIAGNAGLAPLASPAFTGVPTAPTASPGDNSSQLATDNFVTSALNAYAPLVSPVFLGTPTAPTVAQGTPPSGQIATTSFVDARGMQSSGQQQINASMTLTQAQAGSNILLATPGITITFPNLTATYWLDNASGGDINLVFTVGTDFRTVIHPGEQVGLAGDGGGYYRVLAQGGGLQVLSSIVLTSPQSAVTISAIPQNYRHLRLVIWGQVGIVNTSILTQFNGDANNNYSFTYLQGTNSAVSAGGVAVSGSATIGTMSNYGTYPSTLIMDIPGYSSTAFSKMFTTQVYDTSTGLGAAANIQIVAGTWSGTAGITSILVSPGGTTFTTGTIISLYGMN